VVPIEGHPTSKVPVEASVAALDPPSASPMVVPSAPSAVLSLAPTAVPSSAPTAVPSSNPITVPSSAPTTVPSSNPVPVVVSTPSVPPRVAPSTTPAPIAAPSPLSNVVPDTTKQPTLAERQKQEAQKLEKLRPSYATQPSRPLSPTFACWHPNERVLATEDELDALVRQAAAQYVASPSLEHFVKAMRDPHGDFNPHVGHIAHPAAHLLNRLRCSGTPVTCQGTRWTFTQKAAALTRGPHQSASKHIPFLRQEVVDMIHKGQWTVLQARLVLHDPQLRLSLLGVVPQRDRRPRTISDYTFFGVNHETVPVSPSECMQFGRALWRILRHVKSANPHHGPIYLSKIDIVDGFYRIWVRASDVPKLGILFPAGSGEEYLVGFPWPCPWAGPSPPRSSPRPPRLWPT
jgi:hypothetical protein